ncbi:F0F1 ATP synthase subunit A [bacterium]|nr:F0F1 ATP synthase subunit A [bacterium]
MESLNGLSEHINEMVGDFLAPAMYGNDAFGLTQYIFWMIVAIIVLLLVVFAARKREALVPKGRFLNAVEFIVEFVRNDIVYGTIGRKTGDKHMPFILSLFFFILANNIIGIIPGMRPGTGTIGVTFALACYSFVYFVAVAIKNLGVGGYIKSFAPAGVAGPLAVMVGIIEVFSTILRLITLAIRLFANMFAGHIAMGAFALMTTVTLSYVVSVGASAIMSALPAILWMVILIIIYAIEMVVAVIQAYVFAMLSAVYIQLAEAEH